MYFQFYWYPQLFKDIEEMHEPVMRACRETAREENKIPIIINLHEDGQPTKYISKITELPEKKVKQIIQKHNNKK